MYAEVCRKSLKKNVSFSVDDPTSSYSTGDSREKPQGGGAFFHLFQTRLAKKKAPPPWGFSWVCEEVRFLRAREHEKFSPIRMFGS